MAKIKNKTPGQWLDEQLCSQTISFEDGIGVLQTLNLHTTKEDYEKLQQTFNGDNLMLIMRGYEKLLYDIRKDFGEQQKSWMEKEKALQTVITELKEGANV